MKVVQIQFAPWDKVYNFDQNDLALAIGDNVIVKTDLGVEIGKVVGFAEADKVDLAEEKVVEENGEVGNGEEPPREIKRPIKPVMRKATSLDLEKRVGAKEKEEALEYCRKMIEKNKLEMKLVDVNFSFDGAKITFAFIADGRVDFRELVKDLTRHFNRTVRLYQIGIRDEAKIKGDYGPCGRQLCCKRFLGDLASITSEMAEVQQVVHRGSERISGMCGRLMCCLAFEEKGYEEMAKNMPPLGTKVNVDGKRGTVVGHHILKQSVNVQFPGDKGEEGAIIEIDLNRNKKK
ncbi:MAG: regulatory iron-sulfur-containing complex subunit RicT [Patescibacteria group bacterium]|nr:regulatory iron-sulfur-containing complex subunit RicT [Patescibacteria group bacterium]